MLKKIVYSLVVCGSLIAVAQQVPQFKSRATQPAAQEQQQQQQQDSCKYARWYSVRFEAAQAAATAFQGISNPSVRKQFVRDRIHQLGGLLGEMQGTFGVNIGQALSNVEAANRTGDEQQLIEMVKALTQQATQVVGGPEFQKCQVGGPGGQGQGPQGYDQRRGFGPQDLLRGQNPNFQGDDFQGQSPNFQGDPNFRPPMGVPQGQDRQYRDWSGQQGRTQEYRPY